jgi:hypothetical protein
MCSMKEALAVAAAALASVDPPQPGLGSSVHEDYLALQAFRDRVDLIGLRHLAVMDGGGMGPADFSRSTTAWVRRHARRSGRAAAADVQLARRLHCDRDRPLATTGQLLEQGKLSIDHARVIARVTSTMTPAAHALAEPALASAATELEVDISAIVGRQIVRHAEALHADGTDDPAEARRAAAAAGRHLHLSQVGDMWALDALLTPQDGQALRAVLDPLSQPRKNDAGQRDERTAAQRRADALGEAARMLLSTDRLPIYGGHRPQVTVLVDLDTLLARTGDGWYPDGTPASFADTERTGCDARISWIATRTPASPGGPGPAGACDDDTMRQVIRDALRRIAPALGGLPAEILDASRDERLVTPGLRRALAVRDRGCVWPGCDRPPEWCEAHHLTYWSHGGATDLHNLALVCEHHHQTIHKGWQLTRAPDGTVTVTPPTAASSAELTTAA